MNDAYNSFVALSPPENEDFPMNKLLTLITAVFILNCSPAEEMLTPTGPVAQKVGTTCAQEDANSIPWKYCIYRYNDSSEDVMFYFHGINGNERSWENGPLEQKVLAHWRQMRVAPPVIVSVSFGPTWFLAEKNKSPQSGLYNYFFSNVLPNLQEKLKGLNTQKVYLMGLSMGGFNAAQLYLKEPQLFDRVSLICPAMAQVSPHASVNDLQNYINTTGADPQLVHQMIGLARMFFPTEDDWKKHSPNLLAISHGKANLPPAHVSNGTADAWGFYHGNLAFVSSLKQKGARVTNQYTLNGGHCDADASYIANNLISP